MRIRHLFVVTLALLSLLSKQAWSVGYEKPVFWSGKYAGLGGAAVSEVSGAESLYFNPAGLNKSGGTNLTLNFSPTLMQTTAPVTGANTQLDSKRGFAPIGSLLGAYQVMPELTLGVGFYAAGGLAVDYGNVAVGTATNPELKGSLNDFEVSVGAGYEVTPMLRIGAARRLSIYKADLTGFDNPAAPTLNTKFTGLSGTQAAGFRFGVQYGDPSGSWGLGAAFRTRVALRASGTGSTVNLTSGASGTLGATTLETALPLQFTLGGHFDPFTHLRAYLQYDFTQYQNNQSINITTVATGSSTIPLNWKNRNTFRVGTEYTGISKVPVRVSYVYSSAVTPVEIPGIYFSGPAPAHTIALGAGTELAQNLTFDAALDYSFASGTGQPNATATALGIQAGTYKATAYGLHTGVSYKF